MMRSCLVDSASETTICLRNLMLLTPSTTLAEAMSKSSTASGLAAASYMRMTGLRMHEVSCTRKTRSRNLLSRFQKGHGRMVLWLEHEFTRLRNGRLPENYQCRAVWIGSGTHYLQAYAVAVHLNLCASHGERIINS